MNIARVAVLGIAVVASGGAALVAKQFVGTGEVQVVKEEVKVQTTQVLVTSREVGLGHRVVAADLSWQDWPTNAVSDAYVKKELQADALQTYTGAIVRTPMIKGEPVSETKVVKPERGGYMSAILPAGKRAVSAKVSPETGAGGFILPNDRVDVILTVKKDTGTTSEVLMGNIRVLAIDQSLQQEEGKQVPSAALQHWSLHLSRLKYCRPHKVPEKFLWHCAVWPIRRQKCSRSPVTRATSNC